VVRVEPERTTHMG